MVEAVIIHNFPRQSGKTTMLLKQLDADPTLLLVTYSVNSKEYAKIQSKDICENNVTNRIFTIHEIMEGRHKGLVSDPRLLIDELEMCLEVLLNTSIKECTMTAR